MQRCQISQQRHQQPSSLVDNPYLDLMPTSDILKSFNQSRNKETISIGYCFSDHPDILSIAYKKLLEKQCDYIVANTPDSFGRESRSITLIDSKNNTKMAPIITISGELL